MKIVKKHLTFLYDTGYILSFKNYDGITFLFQPEWEKLTEINIWAKGASQILFSLSVAFGSQLVLSSYNNFNNNSHRDSIIVGICNSLTSVYAGIVVFLILGFLADKTGTTITLSHIEQLQNALFDH